VGGDLTLGGRVTAGALSRLEPERTALVVVDLQERLLPAILERERVIQNSVLLLRLAEALSLPVLLTTQYEKGLGPTVPEVLERAAGVTPIDKVTFGCFQSAPFLARLSALAERNQIVVAGIESHICVAQTVLGALSRGFEVHVASDAVGARAEENRVIGLQRMEKAGAVLSSVEMAIYELLGRSDVSAFKKMLPYLRASP
jgi:nicotinamidase-related amidase